MTRRGETLPGRQLGNLVTAQDSSDDIDLSGCRAEMLLLRSNKLTIENHRKSWKIIENHRKSWRIIESHGKSQKIMENHRK
jgi:hypothetical protein